MALDNDVLPASTLTALMEASAAINGSLDLTSTLQCIAAQVAAVVGAEASSVLLLDRSRHKLIFQAAHGQHGPALVDDAFEADAGIAGKVVRTGSPVRVTDVATEGSFVPGIDTKAGFTPRGLIAAPLLRNEVVIGVVEAFNKRDGADFTTEDVELLQIFSPLAAGGVTNAQAYERLKAENRGLRMSQRAEVHIIGQSQALNDTLELCARVAGSDTTVLVLGETGTGKAVFSHHIHAHSPRRDRPFVAIRCAALPETVLESKLFGHEKGAWTDATLVKIGRLELAEGGTLFLDDIGDLPPSTQAKLLRVLREGEFVRMGGTHTVPCDVRIIAATNCDLARAVQEGSFREDLYYRLTLFPIQTPPLRSRRDDIPLLVEHFVETSSQLHGVKRVTVSDEAMAMLMPYCWPGNIRELQNVIERAVLLADRNVIGVAHLPLEIAGETAERSKQPTETTLPGYEKALIVKTLKDHGWNQTRAAKALGISRDNLRYRLKKYQIDKPA